MRRKGTDNSWLVGSPEMRSIGLVGICFDFKGDNYSKDISDHDITVPRILSSISNNLSAIRVSGASTTGSSPKGLACGLELWKFYSQIRTRTSNDVRFRKRAVTSKNCSSKNK
jgi:hypothetical protein